LEGASLKPAVMGLAVAAALGLYVVPARAAPSPRLEQSGFALELERAASSNPQLERFYARRNYRPIWFRNGQLSPYGRQIAEVLDEAPLDGLSLGKLRISRALKALERARTGNPQDLARGETALSTAVIAYAQALNRPAKKRTMHYVDGELRVQPPSAHTILDAAAASQPIERVVQKHPLYMQLRSAYGAWLQASGELDREERVQLARIRLNLERARLLPGAAIGRHIVVDAASARLWMYDGDRLYGSMKVVVGKPTEPTPMMAGLIRYAALNPYWNVPPDLVKVRIAPSVLAEGYGHLNDKGYEVLSDWSDNPGRIDPRRIDWKAVADGRFDLPVRQRPGPANMMGAMKFMFPNDFGVYLHDTPNKELFGLADRKQSSGCVRVEDAKRLAKWMFGKVPKAKNGMAEQHVSLPKPVPVYITYLTVAPQAGRLAFRDDFYGRDGRGNPNPARVQMASN
jgi:L,D-transpeptidase YcbB